MLKLSPSLAMDWSETAFKTAVGMLEAEPSEVEVLTSADWAVDLYKLKEKYGCRVVLLPKELMINQFAWAVRTKTATVFSLGLGQ